MKKRSSYRPRPLNIPVTRGLLDEFSRELHFSLMKAELGYFTKLEFDKIGGCMNCIYGALSIKPPKESSILVVIEGAMRAMNECGQRGRRTKIWMLTLEERAAVCAGVQKMEEALPAMDVMLLYQSMQNLKELQLAEEGMAA